MSRDPHPLEYVTSDALVEELVSRQDTCIMLLYKRDKDTATSLVHAIEGEYVTALGLLGLLPDLIEQVLGPSMHDMDADDLE